MKHRAPLLLRVVLVATLPLLAAGCRSDVGEVRIDLVQAVRLVRAYSALSTATAPPPEAAQLSPERVNDIGVMLERRGLLERAEEHYRLATEQKPDFARAWVNLGNVLRRQQRDSEAADCYRRAMREDPALFEAVNNLADLCADSGRCVDEALALLGPALEEHPPEENVGRDTLGKLYLRIGRNADAAQAFRTALDLTDPRDKALSIEFLRHLAQAYRALGDKDGARSAELRAQALVE
jgi:tetratricopeptide (TPR) repeat protein